MFVLLFLRDASLSVLFDLISDFVISFDNFSADDAVAVAVALVSVDGVDGAVVAVVTDFAFDCASANSVMHFCEIKVYVSARIRLVSLSFMQ